MTEHAQMGLWAFFRPTTIHTAGWRFPGANPRANFDLAELTRAAATLENACFDALFMADHLSLLNMPMDGLKRSHTATSFEPLTLLSALSSLTRHIGLVATGSTTYEEPFHVARRFASLDHLSNGRAGWNIVTTANPDAARNFGVKDLLGHDERYERAREFVRVVTGLWDSWQDDAFPCDPAEGVFFDPHKMNVLDHKGRYFEVKGPLNIARPPQGWPVLVQAGASPAGMRLAAETADVVFTAQTTLEGAQSFYRKIKNQAMAAGRPADSCKVMLGTLVVVGRTAGEAREKRLLMDRLVHMDSALASLSVASGHDISAFYPDGPLPDLPTTNQGVSSQRRVLDIARREGLTTIREIARRVGGYFGHEVVGTPVQVADQFQQWFEAKACDGFVVMFPYLPQGLDDFVNEVVPILQERGIFRKFYEGSTLREHLGLSRPANQFS
ncbi:LLM class flavin-dependent oxidoreductase [Paraburkholderia xenovorans]|uniref:LLM class flavin-dependent oxidoreductase n=1 Tax=Paraburkholderia xenovorans TaxID=36873 RepID=UPI0038BB59F9